MWPLPGPEEDELSLKAVALLFDYDVRSFKRLIAQGLFPAPRGFGQNLFYTGDDVAAMRLLLGRWRPQEEVADEDEPHETVQKRIKGDKSG